jgi:hypothetical protein
MQYDNPLYIAYIDGTEVRRLELTPGHYPEHGSLVDGLRVHHVLHTVGSLSDFIDTHYYDAATDSLLSRPTKPNPYATWEASSTDPADGVWTWDHELLLTQVRAARDRRLNETDWTQVPDNQLTDEQRNDWREYRQALRDITLHCEGITCVGDVVWPSKP